MSYVNEENELVKIKESSLSKVVSQVTVYLVAMIKIVVWDFKS